MIISKDKKYKDKSGREVVIYEVYPENDNTLEKVHGAIKVYEGRWGSRSWTLEGQFSIDPSDNDLIEVSPYDHIKIDDKVLVWNEDENDYYTVNNKTNRYFAGINEEGRPLTWDNGRTSFTSHYKEGWDNCELYEEGKE